MAKRRGSDDESGTRSWFFALGAGAGLLAGMYLGGRTAEEGSTRERLVSGARSAARRLRPARMRPEERDQVGLRGLEDAVLAALLQDDVLSERAIDVGAISAGIIELSGSVRTAAEAARAVACARRARGVDTVVNRLEVQSGIPGRTERGEHGGGEWGGRMSGMGRRRQGRQTDPDRADDAQHIREASLEHADRSEFEEEGLAHSHPIMTARPGPPAQNPTRYSEEELDHQSPYGKHADPQPEQPQAVNTGSRVGEGLRPGLELRLEQADVPVKPHSRARVEAPTDEGV